MRTFVALELSQPVQQMLAQIQSQLRGSLPQAKWTKPEGTHLTLKFLGETGPAQQDQIRAALDSIATHHAPFKLVTATLGGFPKLNFPRVLWVGLERSEALIRLQGDLEKAIAPLGFPSEHREFRGHLTLARLNGESWSPEMRQQFVDLEKLAAGISWEIHRVVFFKSDLKPGGAVYTPLHFSVLQGKVQ